MQPTSTSVKKFLNKVKQENSINEGWVIHSLNIGDAAAKIAAALANKGYDINPEEARIMGYLHDIGKMDGNFNFLGHLLGGYVYLKRLDFPEQYCTAPLTHSFITNDANFTLSSSIFEPEFLPSQGYLDGLSDIIPEPDKQKFITDFIGSHQFTLAENIMSLCDLMCYYDIMTLEQRIVNIISRHGTWQNTQKFINELLKLKADIDLKLGYNLYDLFPEIKNNL